MSAHLIDFTSGKLIPLVTADRFPVGRILTYEDMKNPKKRYAVTSEDATAYGQPLICEDGHRSQCSPACIGRGGWRDTGETLDAAALAQFLADSAANGERLKQEHETASAKAAKERAERKAAALLKYAHLERVPEGGYASAKLAAKNIRTELKRAFPGTKFSVTSDGFSGGDSVDVRWSMGPTAKEVEAITGKYQEGSFNGMEDIYEYDRENVIPDLFGGAKYVQEHREDSPAYELIACALCGIWGIEPPADRKSFWDLNGDRADDVRQTTRDLLSVTSFPAGADNISVERRADGDEGPGSGFAPYYRVTFTAPQAADVAKPAPASMAPPAPAVAGVTITENPEKDGVEIRFPAKPPAFLLDSLKTLGWRWSRFSACWYHKATAEARDFAANIAATFPQNA